MGFLIGDFDAEYFSPLIHGNVSLIRSWNFLEFGIYYKYYIGRNIENVLKNHICLFEYTLSNQNQEKNRFFLKKG